MSSEPAKTLTYEDIEKLNKAYGALPLCPDAAVTCAVNIVILSPHVKASSIARATVLKTHNLPNLPVVKPDPGKVAAVVADMEATKSRTAEVCGLVPIRKSDLRLPDIVPEGMAAEMAVIAQHGLLDLTK